MDEKEILVAEIKGLLRAMERECRNVHFQLSVDNVYNVSLEKIKQYIAVVEKKTIHNEQIDEDLY